MTMFVLTDIERLAIIAGCSGLLCLVIIVTFCLVCHTCWLSKRLMKSKNQNGLLHGEKKGVKRSLNFGSDSFLDTDPPPPYEPTPGITVMELSSPLKLSRKLTSSSTSSTKSDCDSIPGIPLPVLNEKDLPAMKSYDNSTFNPGQVSFTLQYKRVTGEDNKVFSQLRIDLKEATDLPHRAYGGCCDSYFVLSLCNSKANKKKKRRSSTVHLHQFRSMVMKKNGHPVFNESFFFPLESDEIRKSFLKIEAWDKDKWANDTQLGEACLNLKDLAPILFQEPSKGIDLNFKLENPKTNNGELLLGLCYLPTSERMTIAILKANNLKQFDEKLEYSASYVQAMTIYAVRGSPTEETRLNEIVPRKSSAKDPCIGKVIIGSASRRNSLNHWNAMRNCPRRQVIQWHELR